MCEFDSDTETPWIRRNIKEILNSPALIPQVWVNWIHMDFKAELKKSEPQRVDFLMHYEGRQIIIKIDDPSHIGPGFYDVDMKSGRPKLEGSMEKFTQHLKRDRWLRCNGYEVWRFSDLEVMDAKSMDSVISPYSLVDFFCEMAFEEDFYLML